MSDVDHDCMRLKPVDGNVPVVALVAVDMQISPTAKTLAVVFRLFSMKRHFHRRRIELVERWLDDCSQECN